MRNPSAIFQNFLYLFILTFSLFSCSDEKTPIFKNAWDEDVYYFGKNLEEQHVDLFHNISKSEFERDITLLRDSTGQFTEKRILLELGKMIGKIGDSHTQLQYLTKLDRFPYEVSYFDDGIYITGVSAGFESVLGEKVHKIHDIPMDSILELFKTYIPYENESNFKNQVIQYMPFGEFYAHHRGLKELQTLELETENALSVALPQTSGGLQYISGIPTPIFLEDTETFYWYRVLPDKNILFIQYNSCRERSDLSFDAFTQQIDNEISNNPDLDKIVIDLRHNGGGNSLVMKPLIEKLESYVSNQTFSREEIYLIIGRKTFSSALLNTLELKSKIDPIILGEPSGGKPDHYGEVRSFRLPNSGLKVYYSTKFFDNPDTDEASVFPDQFIPYTFQNFVLGEDPVLEEIIK